MKNWHKRVEKRQWRDFTDGTWSVWSRFALRLHFFLKSHSYGKIWISESCGGFLARGLVELWKSYLSRNIPSNTDKKLTKIRIVTGAFENSALILGKLHMYRSYHSLTDYGQGLRFFVTGHLLFSKIATFWGFSPYWLYLVYKDMWWWNASYLQTPSHLRLSQEIIFPEL